MGFREEILVFCGPMRSGKSKQLLLHVDKLDYSRIPYILVKPSLDNRVEGKIFTRYLKHTIEAIEIEANKPESIIDIVKEKIGKDLNNLDSPFSIIVDEAQFFSNSIVDVVKELNSKGIKFIIAGLDLDANSNPFGPMGNLMAIATKVVKLQAICEFCRNTATKTGLTKFVPNFNVNNVMIEEIHTNNDLFISLCTKCYFKNLSSIKLKDLD